MSQLEQQFLNELDSKLWKAADKLRSSLDAANYKHIVLGLIFIKYVSDAFEMRRDELKALFDNNDEDNIYYLDPEFYDSDAEYQQALVDELEIRDYYSEKNVFWVPKMARWDFIKETAALSIGTVLKYEYQGEAVTEEQAQIIRTQHQAQAADSNDKDPIKVIKLTSVTWIIDNAMDEIEKANKTLKNVLNRIDRYQLHNDKLKGLIDSFSDTSFNQTEYQGHTLNINSKDILGHIYEYFLGQFALAEGKQGGQYYTPKSIVTLIVEMLQPYQGRIYDPAMGSGGFFISSDKFIARHAGEKQYNASEQRRQVSIYGQESNPTTWKLAAMNLAIRGMDYEFGEHADSFLNDQHPDLRADFVMANPPFNIKDWWHEKLADDARWQYGTPPEGNANFAWIQHMLYHLAPSGSMALLLANGSMSSQTSGEGDIRQALIEADLVECIVALPGQLFTNTQIPACIWFLSKDKANGFAYDVRKRDRQGEVLFIDARDIGYMKDRVLRDFTDEDIERITSTFHNWQEGKAAKDADKATDSKGYKDIAGFCYSANLEDMQKHDYVLTPGRYVGSPEVEEDSEPFADKMTRLTATLSEQFAQSSELEQEIKKNLAGLGYGV
ncbi:type I restriction-modification system subunit M [Psychrobacter sp. PAMC 21119]|uniref:class I SAM-dependent DNA methyltransferase n=1 Tax=Psychrobacter sp. PAMC 21119 TaxID=1112209 RepID=UPI000474CD3F|nr:type I restriction-modification system subunit M [Psychrobacter sp. PAMC 21119]